jgi:hypothetical protein
MGIFEENNATAIKIVESGLGVGKKTKVAALPFAVETDVPFYFAENGLYCRAKG